MVRKQTTAENGDVIVALVDNEVTIKEYSVSAHAIVLKPRSTNRIHKPIVARNDFQVQGVMVTVIPNLQG